MDELQSIWPQWEIVEKIGQGAYGKVYKIRRKDIGYISYAAMKIIEFPQDQSEVRELLNSGMDFQSVRMYYEDIKANLLNEIQVMESLKTGRNIVAIEDHCFQEKEQSIGWSIYIRMELLESLDNYLVRMKTLPVEEIIKIGVDICSSLECCEQSHVIHRDIKPDNIFRNRYGDYKLGDFGIAKQMEQTKSAYSHKGTSMYMAPEVYRGERYNRSVDIYSLGIMLYRLLNHGRYPFMPPAPSPMVQSDQENALRKRMNGETMPLPDGSKNLLGSVVLKACAYKPEWRYGSASEFQAELLRASQEERPECSKGAYAGNTVAKPIGETPRNLTEELPIPKEEDMPQKSDAEKTYSAWGDNLKKTEPKQSEQKKDPQPTPQPTPPFKTEKKSPGTPTYQWVPNGESDELIDTGGPSEAQKRQRKKRWAIIGGIILVVLIISLISGYKKKLLADKEDFFDNAEYNLNNGYYDAAEEQYQFAIEKYPDDSRGYLGFAEFYLVKEAYQDALDVLERGKENCLVIAGISEKYDKISEIKEYNELLATANQFSDESDFEQAVVYYQQAIKENESRPEAYEGLIRCYIKQNNLAEADKLLESSATILGEITIEPLEKACELQKINNMMESSDYAGLLSYYSGSKDVLGDEDYYFQNGEILNITFSGTGMIVSANGVYTGEIADGKRNGRGKQFGIYSGNVHYNLTEGQWKNNSANGQCTDTHTLKTSDNAEWVFIYTGNVTDNLYDGDMLLQWSKPDGSEAGSANVHADKGTFPVVREVDGKYVYADGGDWYWYASSQEGLKNRGVWNSY